MVLRNNIGLYILVIAATMTLCVSCGGDKQCNVSIGATNFSIEPNVTYGLYNVGGFQYFTGGYRGVVVVRTGYDRFAAFERACPEDNNTAVVVSEEWGSTMLECPTCHSCFIVEADGMPLDGSATRCPLYQYNTTYSGGVLYVY